MKRHILSLFLVGAFVATTLIAQNESPTPAEESIPTPAAKVEPDLTPEPTPTPTIAATAATATPALTPQKPTPRRKHAGASIKLGEGEDGLTINFGAGDPDPDPDPNPNPPEPPDFSDSRHSDREVPEDPKITILKEVVLPVIFVVFIFGGPVAIVALVLFYRMRKNRLLHQTIASLVASGQPIPPELLNSTGAKALPTPDSDLRKGIILCMVGLGLIGFFLGVGGPWGLGCIPLAWGGGHLLTAKFAPRSAVKSTEPL